MYNCTSTTAHKVILMGRECSLLTIMLISSPVNITLDTQYCMAQCKVGYHKPGAHSHYELPHKLLLHKSKIYSLGFSLHLTFIDAFLKCGAMYT